MAEDFANLAKVIYQQIQKVKQTPHRLNIREFTSNHMIMKLLKPEDKGRNESIKREMTPYLRRKNIYMTGSTIRNH